MWSSGFIEYNTGHVCFKTDSSHVHLTNFDYSIHYIPDSILLISVIRGIIMNAYYLNIVISLNLVNICT